MDGWTERKRLTMRRYERTRSANHIKHLITYACDPVRLPASALPFWRDQVLYEMVRKLVRAVREWHWIEDSEEHGRE